LLLHHILHLAKLATRTDRLQHSPHSHSRVYRVCVCLYSVSKCLLGRVRNVGVCDAAARPQTHLSLPAAVSAAAGPSSIAHCLFLYSLPLFHRDPRPTSAEGYQGARALGLTPWRSGLRRRQLGCRARRRRGSRRPVRRRLERWDGGGGGLYCWGVAVRVAPAVRAWAPHRVRAEPRGPGSRFFWGRAALPGRQCGPPKPVRLLAWQNDLNYVLLTPTPDNEILADTRSDLACTCPAYCLDTVCSAAHCTACPSDTQLC
jgi:hypothetical protein